MELSRHDEHQAVAAATAAGALGTSLTAQPDLDEDLAGWVAGHKPKWAELRRQRKQMLTSKEWSTVMVMRLNRTRQQDALKAAELGMMTPESDSSRSAVADAGGGLPAGLVAEAADRSWSWKEDARLISVMSTACVMTPRLEWATVAKVDPERPPRGRAGRPAPCAPRFCRLVAHSRFAHSRFALSACSMLVAAGRPAAAGCGAE